MPSTKNATLTVNIGGVDSTMSVEKFAAQVAPPETLDIIADGTIGSSTIVNYQFSAEIPGTINGQISIPVTNVPQINIVNYSGAPTTATLLEFSNLTKASSLSVILLNLLELISCPELKSVFSSLQINDNINLKVLNFPKLININNGLTFGNTPLLTEVNFPLLEIAAFQIGQNSGLTGCYQSSFPSLKSAGFSLQYNNISTFEIEMPLVTTLTGFSGQFTRVYLPNLININTTYIGASNSPNLVEFNIGTPGILKSFANNSYMPLMNSGFNEESVNNLLILLASLDGTNGTTISSNGQLDLQGGTNAAPSGDGLIAKDKLLARGWFIQTN
jgi:hypothetical protein